MFWKKKPKKIESEPPKQEISSEKPKLIRLKLQYYPTVLAFYEHLNTISIPSVVGPKSWEVCEETNTVLTLWPKRERSFR